MKKNTAGQSVGAQVVDASDGSAFTGSVTVAVTGDAGTQATGSVGSGACTHEGNGFHTYAPAQAETNYDHVAFTFTGSGAIPVTIQIYTTFPQTGDSFSRLGSPAGASVSADISTIDGNVDSILVDTAEIGSAGAGLTAVPWNSSWDSEVQSEVDDGLKALGLDHLLSTSVTGTDIADDSIVAQLASKSATADWDSYDNTTDALEAIRDRGDSAWTTGGGGSNPTVLQNTTIATLSSQTSFTLTAGSADDDAYNGMLAIVTDQSTSTQKAVGVISDYTGSSKTVTLREDPGVFTMATGDTIDVVAITPDTLSILADTNELQGDWANGGRLDLILDARASQTSVDNLNDLDAAGIRTAVGMSSADLDTQLDAINTNVNGVQNATVTKNAAYSDFVFPMKLTSDHYSAATGKTVTGQRSLDGGSLASVSGTITEISNGLYQFDADAADTNGDTVTWRFSAADCDDTVVTFKTST